MNEGIWWTVVGLGATVGIAVISALVSRLHTLERQLGLLEASVAAIAARQEVFAREREQQRRQP